MNYEDVTGHPRPRDQIEAALQWANHELIKNPTRMGADGTPSAMHLIVIRDVLRQSMQASERIAKLEAAIRLCLGREDTLGLYELGLDAGNPVANSVEESVAITSAKIAEADRIVAICEEALR